MQTCLKKILFSIMVLTMTLLAGAAAEPDHFAPDHIKATLIQVAQRQLQHPEGKHDARGWNNGVLYMGIMAAHQTTGDPELLSAVMKMGEANQWRPGAKLMFPDHHIIFHPYLSLYQLRQEPHMLEPARTFVDAYLKSPTNDSNGKLITWWLCDYLFMDPPVLVKLGRLLDRPELLEKSDVMWHECYDQLFDRERNLFNVSAKNDVYKGFKGIAPGEKEANGEPIFWACGNGWVLGGLALLLEELPTDYAQRPFYEDVYRRMARSVAALQLSEGVWRASLLDPDAYPRAESNATSLFTYALAYGVRAGILPRQEFAPVIRKAWTGLNTICLQPDFRVGWSEGGVARPIKGYRQDSTSLAATGLFLLAGSEMLRQ